MALSQRSAPLKIEGQFALARHRALAAPLRAAGAARRAIQQQSGAARRRLAGGARLRASAAPLLSPGALFGASTLVVMPLYALMIAAPRARITRRVLGSPLFYLSAAALYATLLVAWRHLLSPVWEAAAAGAAAAAAGALPDVAAFAALFARPAVTAVAWVHLLLLDLFQARWVWEDGVSWGVPVGHSAVLCFMAAPLGLLSHLATKAAVRWTRRRRGGQEPQFVVYRF